MVSLVLETICGRSFTAWALTIRRLWLSVVSCQPVLCSIWLSHSSTPVGPANVLCRCVFCRRRLAL